MRSWTSQHTGSLRAWEDTFSVGERVPRGELCATVYEGDSPVPIAEPDCVPWD